MLGVLRGVTHYYVVDGVFWLVARVLLCCLMVAKVL